MKPQTRQIPRQSDNHAQTRAGWALQSAECDRGRERERYGD